MEQNGGLDDWDDEFFARLGGVVRDTDDPEQEFSLRLQMVVPGYGRKKDQEFLRRYIENEVRVALHLPTLTVSVVSDGQSPSPRSGW